MAIYRVYVHSQSAIEIQADGFFYDEKFHDYTFFDDTSDKPIVAVFPDNQIVGIVRTQEVKETIQ